MKRTVVVNLRVEQHDVYIGRAGKGEAGYFGNPFPLTRWNDAKERSEVLEKYEAYFMKRIQDDAEFKRRVLELKGKRLGCFCKPQACHGDVIAAWIEGGAK